MNNIFTNITQLPTVRIHSVQIFAQIICLCKWKIFKWTDNFHLTFLLSTTFSFILNIYLCLFRQVKCCAGWRETTPKRNNGSENLFILLNDGLLRIDNINLLAMRSIIELLIISASILEVAKSDSYFYLSFAQSSKNWPIF